MTTLADLDSGATVLLHNTAVRLDEFDHHGPRDARGSAAYGLDLTNLRRGRRREKVFLSRTSVERLAAWPKPETPLPRKGEGRFLLPTAAAPPGGTTAFAGSAVGTLFADSEIHPPDSLCLDRVATRQGNRHSVIKHRTNI